MQRYVRWAAAMLPVDSNCVRTCSATCAGPLPCFLSTQSDGVILGTFCVMDPDANDLFDDSAQAILEVMARTVMSQLEVADMKRKREQLQQHLLANVSHELRTHIHGVLGLCDLLAEQPTPTSSHPGAVNEIRQEAESMMSLVNDMLDHVKLDAGQLSTVPLDFCLHTLLSELPRIVQPAATRARVEVKLLQPYTAEAFCNGDASRVRQILLNLIGNAVKFSHAEHVVEVRVRHLEQMPEQLIPSNLRCFYHSPTANATTSSPDPSTFFLYVQVADTGCGISPARLSTIFDSCSHEELHTAEISDGAGFGLGLCKQLTELLRGMMLVESEEGVGSVFHVVLPLRWCGQDDKERATLALYDSSPTQSVRSPGEMTPIGPRSRRLNNFNLSRGEPRGNSAPLQARLDNRLMTYPGGAVSLSSVDTSISRAVSTMHSCTTLTTQEASNLILVVDDNQVNQKVAIRFLSSHGYACVSAFDGYEALEVREISKSKEQSQARSDNRRN